MAGTAHKGDTCRIMLDDSHLAAPAVNTVRTKVPNERNDRPELL